MRIPPTVQPDRAGAVLKEVLEADPPLGMQVKYDLKKAGTGAQAAAAAAAGLVASAGSKLLCECCWAV
jgi:hypothetical protein